MVFNVNSRTVDSRIFLEPDYLLKLIKCGCSSNTPRKSSNCACSKSLMRCTIFCGCCNSHTAHSNWMIFDFTRRPWLHHPVNWWWLSSCRNFTLFVIIAILFLWQSKQIYQTSTYCCYYYLFIYIIINIVIGLYSKHFYQTHRSFIFYWKIVQKGLAHVDKLPLVH